MRSPFILRHGLAAMEADADRELEMDSRLMSIFSVDQIKFPRKEWAELRCSVALDPANHLNDQELARLRTLRADALRKRGCDIAEKARVDGSDVAASIAANRKDKKKLKQLRKQAALSMGSKEPTGDGGQPRRYKYDPDCHYSIDGTKASASASIVPLHPDYDPGRYAELLEAKRKRIEADFKQFWPSALHLEIFGSPPQHYRLRCKFGVRKVNDTFCFTVGPNSPSITSDYPIVSVRINDLMPKVLRQLTIRSELSNGIISVHFLSTLGTNDAVICLIYGRNVLHDGPAADASGTAKSRWMEAAQSAAEEMGGEVSLIAKAKGTHWIYGKDYVFENLHLGNGDELIYRQAVGSFSNPNGHVNIHSLNWLRSCCSDIRQHCPSNTFRLLELYCGCGNHTVALATFFSEVVAVELDPALVLVARENLKANGIDNAVVHRVAAEEYAKESHKFDTETTACDVKIEFRFNVILLDPPRAGIDPVTLELAMRFSNILIISCNQSRLHNTLKTMQNTHEVKRFTLMDHFPYTAHTECGVWLQKRDVGIIA